MNTFSPAARVALVAASTTVVILGMRIASPVITPVLLALVIAVVWSAFPSWLRSKGIEGFWTTVVALSSLVVVFAVFGLLVTVYLIRFDDRLPEYQDRLDVVQMDIEGFINDLGISDEPIDLSGVFADKVFSADRLTSLAQDAVTGTFAAAGLLALIFLLLLFMLAESNDWGKKLASLPTTETDLGPHIADFVADIRRWLLITFGMGLLVAVPCTIAFMLFQIDFAILWGIFILVMSFVPSIGFIISVIPPVAMAWLLHGPDVAGAVLLTIIVINTAVDNFLKPRIVGRSLSMSPLVLIIGVVFWAWVLGPLGAFLSTPLTILLRFALQTHPDTEWLARMMGTAPDDAPELNLELESGDA